MFEKKQILFFLSIVIIILFVKIIIAVNFGNNPEKAEKILKVEGYSNIQFTGVKFLSCGKYFYSTGFKGEKNGISTEGTVCQGLLFKGAVVKLD